MTKTAVAQKVEVGVPGLVTGPGCDHINDWVRETWRKLGDVNDLGIFPTDVIVAHFQRTKLGSGVLLAAKQTQAEDKYQGKVGLVVALGGNVFVDAPDAQFYGFKVKIGDWVVYKNSDGREQELCAPATADRVLTRVLKDGEVYMTVPRPDRVW